MSAVHAYKPASRELPVPIGMNIAHWFALTTARLIVKSACQWNCVGSENVPLEGGIIIAVNHQSFLDPPLVALASPRQDIVYLAKSEIMAWPVLGRLFPQLHVIPVDQQNADRTALRHLINIVRTGHVAVIFPEGGRTPDGEIQAAQAGIGFVVGKTLCPVVPMRIWGAYEAYPMGGRPRMHPISVRVGKPLTFTKADFESGDRIDYQICADRILDAIKALTL
jgi:1-acyl-sn-glycerol-3-phosphate acyltransferase